MDLCTFKVVNINNSVFYTLYVLLYLICVNAVVLFNLLTIFCTVCTSVNTNIVFGRKYESSDDISLMNDVF